MVSNKDIVVRVKPVDISSAESHGPIRIGVRTTENITYNSENYYPIEADKNQKITIENIPDRFPEDANVWIEMFLKTEDTYVRSGECSLSFKELIEGGSYKKEITYHQLQNETGVPVKAKIYFEIEKEKLYDDTSKKVGAKSLYTNEYQWIDSNSERINQVLESNGNQAYKFIQMEPLNEHLNGVAAPYDRNNTVVPTKVFLLSQCYETMPISEAEDMFLNNIRLALRRSDMSEEDFNDVVDELFNMESYESLEEGSLDILKVSEVVSRSTTYIAVSRNYVSDKGYYKGKVIDIENFQHTERIEALDPSSQAKCDCEDSACTIVACYRGLQSLGKKFKTRTARNASRIANLYTVGAALCTVTGTQLEQNGRLVKVHIGDENESKLDVGAHMFAMAVSNDYFSRMIFDEDQDKFAVSKEKAKYFELSSYFPVQQLEGTGSLHPRPLPNTSYVGKNLKKQALEMHLNYIKAQVSISQSDTESIEENAKLEKMRTDFEDEEGAYSIFYLSISDFIVMDYNDFGDHLIFTNNQKNVRGAYFRNIFLDDAVDYDYQNEEYYQEPKLMMFKRESGISKKMLPGLAKQTPPNPGNYLSETSVERRLTEHIFEGKSRTELIENFNKTSSNLTKGRKGKKTQNLNFFYVRDEFFFSKGQKKSIRLPSILADINNNKKIISTHASVDCVSEWIHVVNLEVEVDISDLEYKPEKHQKLVESFTPKNFIEGGNNIFEKKKKKFVGHNYVKWIEMDNSSGIMEYFMKLLQQLSEYTDKQAKDDKNYKKEKKKDPKNFREITEKFYGFRTVIALLKMGHIQKKVAPVLEDIMKKRAIVLPFVSVRECDAIPDVLRLGEEYHLKVLLDHVFYPDKEVLPNEYPEFRVFPTLNNSDSSTIKKYLMLERKPKNWPDSGTELILAKVKELTKNSSKKPLINLLDPKLAVSRGTYGKFLTDKKLNIEFFVNDGVILDKTFFIQ